VNVLSHLWSTTASEWQRSIDKARDAL